MKNTIECISKDKCTGCGACYNKCPVNAITMKYNEEGFIYPSIDSEKCIDCGLCLKVCATEKEAPIIAKQKYYAVWGNEELRKKSSSGGMFTLLARYVLRLKGVVCGCRYSDDYRYAYHTIVESEEDLQPLRKSKYFQSETKEVYRQIESYLRQHRWVLFTGTPCQVAGLYAFLGNDFETLITADIVCHGVPSVKAYQKFLEEYSQGKDIECVDFRDKSRIPWGTIEYVKFKDGSHYYSGMEQGMWYKTFLGGMSTRLNCGNCQYSYEKRPADFSLGDFWGISSLLPKIDYRYGVSLVLANSHKAHKLFKNIVRKEKYIRLKKEKVIELAQKRNVNLLRATPNHYARSRFFELLDKEVFSKAAEKALYAKYDIGIVGWWYNLNYGGTLTYYALHQALRKMGFSVMMIDRATNDPNYKPSYKSIPYRFAMKNYFISKTHLINDMTGLNDHCKAFISGSDQLFNPVLWKWSGPQYFLHFVNGNNRKISYASSFGNGFSDIPGLTEKMGYWLNRFDAISVREDYGVDIAKERFGIEATKVLDPVFLCEKEEYFKLTRDIEIDVKNNFFVNFILDPSEEKRDIIYYAQEKLHKQFVNLINADHIEENRKKLNMDNTKADADIEEWLYYYQHSDFIITDSFHGTCFAIIFQKPFISIANTQRGEKRFISLLTELNLMDRLIYTFDEIKSKEYLFETIDYTEVNKIIESKKEQSLKWLYNAITEKKNIDGRDKYKLLENKIFELELEIERLKRKK